VERVVERFWPAQPCRFELKDGADFAVTVEPLLIRRSQVGQAHASNKADPQLDGEANHAAEQLLPLTGRDWNHPRGGGDAAGNGLDGTGCVTSFAPSASLILGFPRQNPGLIRPWGHKTLRGGQWTDAVLACF